MSQKFIDYCSSRKATAIDFPFDENVLVFKVMGKIFALTNMKSLESINLKCDPAYAIVLRQQHPGDIQPGYHMNKKHWNTVSLVGSLEEQLIFDLIDHSWEMTVKGFNRATREKLGLF
ncbi:MAG: MmcQ/YjbR family DNA-binding protein [Deferribacteres bacterium]|nr:MmcQ/YjbR family DNA-binding protein [candidate division KSB1 bacterium]MCB9503783.1 MmcQ/YjbR family DNA-binding protein [Deferribacteres bacterium]